MSANLPAKTRVAYSPGLIEKVCELLEQGKSLRQIAQMPGMPSRMTLWRWCELHPEHVTDIARARSAGWDELAERALEEAETATDPAKGRLTFDARRWFLAKMDPARYGERQHVKSEISGPNGSPIEIENPKSEEEVMAQVQRIFDAAQARRDAQLEIARVNGEQAESGSPSPSEIRTAPVAGV